MREKILVNLLEEKKVPVNLKAICHIMNLSESTIRNLIKEIKLTSEKDGFTICLLRGKWKYHGFTTKSTFRSE